MFYKNSDSLLPVALVFAVLFAVTVIGDSIFAKDVAQREAIQFMGYDDQFFIVTVTEEGETRFNVEFRMYERLEVGQEVFVSYSVGKMAKYRKKIMEID